MMMTTWLIGCGGLTTMAPVRTAVHGDTVCERVTVEQGCTVNVCLDLKPAPVSWLQGRELRYPPARWPASGGCGLSDSACMDAARNAAVNDCNGPARPTKGGK